MSDFQTITRKVQIYPIGDKEEVNRVYQYIRDSMYNQNKAYNILISNVYGAIYSGKSNEEISEIYKKGGRIPKKDKPDYSLYKYGEITFPKGMKTQSSITQRVKADIKTAQSEGLFKGKSTLPNKKLNAPLIVESQQFSFYHNYESYNDFLDALYTDKLEVFMKFVNGINFKIVFGNVHKSQELRSVIKNIFEENYKIQQSSIQFDKKTGKKIILNLSIQIPKNKCELNEDIVVGVDLGIAIPAVCGLNCNDYKRAYIGSKEKFLNVRTKIQAQRKRLKKSLKDSNGGHGRKKKMKPMNRFTKYESNFVQTYNHMVSKRIVDFALKNKAKYINIENLEGFDTNKFILRNWSYYQLQQYITYKAEMNGITVRKINPAYTSQKCSCCGYVDSQNRPKEEKGQAYFKCLNCGEEMNADFNASRNIAMSTDFV